jgi:hypothetical protein
MLVASALLCSFISWVLANLFLSSIGNVHMLLGLSLIGCSMPMLAWKVTHMCEQQVWLASHLISSALFS